MKFHCPVPTPENEWHSWFAWYPVRVEDGSCRWLETVLTRAEHYSMDGWYGYIYKALED